VSALKNLQARLGLIFLCLFWTSPLLADTPLSISFTGEEVGKIPSGWQTLDGANAAKVYSVQAEGDKKFLRADSKGMGIQIGYSKKWALREYPILQWQWRAVYFPTGTNEREKNGNDSVVALYVVFGNYWPFIRAIKYIWSDTLPVGAIFPSPHNKGTRMIVVRSGRVQAGTWVQERRDVLSDYFQVFGEGEKNPVSSGLAVLTDSDNTNSHAIGDYFEFHALGPEGGKEMPH
jgi:hypothetical protein